MEIQKFHSRETIPYLFDVFPRCKRVHKFRME
jgi:hypothetical protein